MTLSTKLGVVEISTLWHFRLPLLIQMFIKVASSPRLSGIGMPSPILWSHLLKMQRIVLLISLLWWELGTNSLITSPGEWLSFRRFGSKLSWSWSWNTLLPFSDYVWKHLLVLGLDKMYPPPNSKRIGLGSPLAACSMYGDLICSVHTVNNFHCFCNYQTHVCLWIWGPYIGLAFIPNMLSS